MMVEGWDVPMEPGKKFFGEVSEPAGVMFAFAHGAVATAILLIKARNIRSQVRQYIIPDMTQQYSSFIGVTSEVPKPNSCFPRRFDTTNTVSFSGRAGTFVLAP